MIGWKTMMASLAGAAGFGALMGATMNPAMKEAPDAPWSFARNGDYSAGSAQLVSYPEDVNPPSWIETADLYARRTASYLTESYAAPPKPIYVPVAYAPDPEPALADQPVEIAGSQAMEAAQAVAERALAAQAEPATPAATPAAPVQTAALSF